MMIEKYPSYNFDNFFSLKLFYERCQLIFVHSSGFPFYRVVPLLLILMNEPVGLSECPVKEGNFCFKIVSLKPVFRIHIILIWIRIRNRGNF